MREWASLNKKEESSLDKIRYAGPKYEENEYEVMMDAIFNNWWSGGKYTIEAEELLRNMMKRQYGVLTNSGSSSNLLLMAAAKELYFKDGDKILTLACGFPTTVNPIIQNGLIPVFVDIDIRTLNLNPEILENALKKDTKIKGIFVAHTLGFKSNIKEILNIARKYDIEVFFDCCDAYGTLYDGEPIASYGKASTYSFFVAHHVSMGEGGGITTNDNDLFTIIRGMRNWGKYCASPKCCIRAENPELFCPATKFTKNSLVPEDFPAGYQFEWLGYNLKPLELQSAMLTVQLKRLEEFNKMRKDNYKYLYDRFNSLNYNYERWEIDEEVSPFAFPFMIPVSAPFKRKHLIDYLKLSKIESRVLFGGNLTKHPAFVKNKDKFEICGTLYNSDDIMNRLMIIGVSPVSNNLEKVIETITEFERKW